MKKILSCLMASAMVLMATGCTDAGTSSKSQNGADSTSADTKKISIGVVQLAEHPALDYSYQGFVDGLKENGYIDGENITIDYNNAQGEQANCTTIAQKLINNKSDLIYAIATPAAQATATLTDSIPILASAVTDFKAAKLVKENEKPETNVTGTSDLNPIEKQMDMLIKLVPEVKTVGMLYCSSESNSEFQVKLATDYLKTKGIEVINATVSASNEIQQVVTSLNGKVDAIYAPTDNMISTSMVLVADICAELKIPTVCGEPEQVKNGGLATDGIDYYALGKQTAKMAVKILKGDAQPKDMPIEYLEDTVIYLNQITADKLGLKIPQDILDSADKVIKE